MTPCQISNTSAAREASATRLRPIIETGSRQLTLAIVEIIVRIFR